MNDEFDQMKIKIRKLKFYETRSKKINPRNFKKRLYFGINEIYKIILHDKYKKFNLILIARDIDFSNLEKNNYKNLLSICKKKNIPIINIFNKKQLAKFIKINSCCSAIGIINI